LGGGSVGDPVSGDAARAAKEANVYHGDLIT